MSIIRKKLNWARLLFLLCFFYGSCYSQQSDTTVVDSIREPITFVDSLKLRYSFINLDTNRIENDSLLLTCFFPLLDSLQVDSFNKIVNVLHIGDSHIQADVFSGKVREKFHADFPNAGRGFVFPYKAAKTNGPYNYKTSTNTQWESKRNVFPDRPLPIGASGITIETHDTSAYIAFSISEKEKLDYSFSKITLFHEKGKGSFNYLICDNFNCVIAELEDDTSNLFTSVAHLAKPSKDFVLKVHAKDSVAQCGRVYGMVLENEKPGLMYHMVGVNGGEYRHYNVSVYFTEQVSSLKPDLIILSMGTNEAYHSGFNPDLFYKQIDTLVTKLKEANPKACFLFTTPGDSYRRQGRYKVFNPDMTKARNTIVQYANNHKMPYWDLYSVMGGYKSMSKWYQSNLTAKDRLHFNADGYRIQGELFYDAIMKSYKRDN